MENEKTAEWFAIKTRYDFRAEQQLKTVCCDVLFPKEKSTASGGKKRIKAVIPRVLFVKTTEHNILTLERQGREHPELTVPFWIYRYPRDNRIQVISPESIRLLRLLTAGDTTRCEIFNKKDIKENQHVRVIGGPFKGYEGFVQRVQKNKHVIVKIEGVCMIMLPFIHPDLLEIID